MANVLHAVVLVVHIAAGGSGLVLGPLAMRAPKRRGRHVRFGLGYQGATATLAASALGLVAFDPSGLWWLGVIGVATEAAALGGWWVRRARVRRWLVLHVNLMCSSYVSFLTAFLVVNWASPLAWLLPTVVATPLIGRATARAARPRLPTPVPAG